jgi:hypothetical protein
MKKLIQILIVCLVGTLFVGCGEKLSAEAKYCQTTVDKMVASEGPPPGGVKNLKEACVEYKGSTEPGPVAGAPNVDMIQFFAKHSSESISKK